MDDNQLDIYLKAYFGKKIPLKDDLVRQTKLRLQQKAEKKENLMLCLIQIGFVLMVLMLGALLLAMVGVNTVIILLAVGYLTLVGLSGVLIAMANSKQRIVQKGR